MTWHLPKTNTDYTWGIGIEHEYRTTLDTGKKFKAIRAPVGFFSLKWTPSGVVPFRFLDKNNRRENSEELKDVISVTDEDGTVVPGYETASFNWKNKTVEQQVKKMDLTKEYILSKLGKPKGMRRKSQFPFAQEVQKRITSGYQTGSFHITITLPYKLRTGIEKLNKNMFKYCKLIQWIEPLLISKLGSTHPFSVGDTTSTVSYAEGSIRGTEEDYSNLGGISLNSYPVSEARKVGLTRPWRRLVKLSNIRRTSSGSDFRQRGEGVELRFLDTFDGQGLKDVLKTLVYVGSEAEETENEKIANSDDDWNKATAKIMEEGWNAYLPKSYIEKLKNVLNIPLNTKSIRASDVMSQVEKELWEKHKESNTSKLMIDDNSKQPEIYNFNKDSWNFSLKQKLIQEKDSREKFIDFVSGFRKISYQGDNWINADIIDKQPGYKQLVEQVLGRKWSAEDTRDIIDFLEGNKILQVERNEDMTIKRIRIKDELLSTQDIRKKLKSVIENPNYFEEEKGLIEYPFEGTISSGIPVRERIEMEISRGRDLLEPSNRRTEYDRFIHNLEVNRLQLDRNLTQVERQQIQQLLDDVRQIDLETPEQLQSMLDRYRGIKSDILRRKLLERRGESPRTIVPPIMEQVPRTTDMAQVSGNLPSGLGQIFESNESVWKIFVMTTGGHFKFWSYEEQRGTPSGRIKFGRIGYPGVFYTYSPSQIKKKRKNKTLPRIHESLMS